MVRLDHTQMCSEVNRLRDTWLDQQSRISLARMAPGPCQLLEFARRAGDGFQQVTWAVPSCENADLWRVYFAVLVPGTKLAFPPATCPRRYARG